MEFNQESNDEIVSEATWEAQLGIGLATMSKSVRAMETRYKQDCNDNHHDFSVLSQVAAKPEIKNDQNCRADTYKEDKRDPHDRTSVENPNDAKMADLNRPHCSENNSDSDIFAMSGPNQAHSNKACEPTTLTTPGANKTREDINHSNQMEGRFRNRDLRGSCSESSKTPQCLCDKGRLPHSNSLTYQGLVQPPFKIKENPRENLKKEYSFPLRHKEKPHHSVFCPFYRLTCTPNTNSSIESNPDEKIEYPINVIRRPFDLAPESLMTSQNTNNREFVPCLADSLGSSSLDYFCDRDEYGTKTEYKNNRFNIISVEENTRLRSGENIENRLLSNYVQSSAESHNREGLQMQTNTETFYTNTSTVSVGKTENISNNYHELARVEYDISTLPLSSYSPSGLWPQPAHKSGQTMASKVQNVTELTKCSNIISSCDSDRKIRCSDSGANSSTVPLFTKDGSIDVNTICTPIIDFFKDSVDVSGTADKTPDWPVFNADSRHTTCRQMELKHVQQVYQQIAPQCDHVRQKAWPKVKRFLTGLEPGSLVADVGCGNGRYCSVNPAVLKFGCDTCQLFLEQARGEGHEVLLADNISLPYRDAIFDAVISIGVIHHFASLERRVQALLELSRVLVSGGRLMIYVWAFEQIHRKFESQDVLIPWIKPEEKRHIRRGTGSHCSEPDRISLSSLGSSASEEDTSTPTTRWRIDRNKSDGFLTEGWSKSLSGNPKMGSEPSLNNNGNSNTQTQSMCSKFGVFDKRNSTGQLGKRELSRGRQVSEEEATSDDPAAVTRHGIMPENILADNVVTFSKWPSQLVSECRKLGKFLRSLSSKSDSQSVDSNDGEKIEKEVEANAEASIREEEQSLLGAYEEEKEESDTCDDVSSIKSSFLPCGYNLNCEAAGNFKRLFDLSNNGNKMLRCSMEIAEASLTSTDASVVYSDSSVTSSAYNVSVPHNTHLTNNSSAITNVTGTSSTGSASCSSYLGPSTDISEASRNEANTTFSYLQLPTLTAVSSSPDESDAVSSGNRSGSPFLSDVPECGSPANIDTQSESGVTVSSSSSFTSIDPVSTNSDKTVTNINSDAYTSLVNNEFDARNCARTGQSHDDFSSNRPEVSLNQPIPWNIKEDKAHTQSSTDKKTSKTENATHNDFKAGMLNAFKSRSNTSTEMTLTMSNLADSTDRLGSDRVFSVDQGRSSGFNSSTRAGSGWQKDYPHTQNQPHCLPLKRIRASRDREKVTHKSGYGDIPPPPGNGIGIPGYGFNPFGSDDTQGKDTSREMDTAKTAQEVSHIRLSFKSIFMKIAHVFHLRSSSTYKPFGNYQKGKPQFKMSLMETDSSDIETSTSNISTHSSSYQGMFPDVKTLSSSGTSVKSDAHFLESPGNTSENIKSESITKETLETGISSKKDRAGRDFVDDVCKREISQQASYIHSHKPHTNEICPNSEKRGTLIQSLTQKWSTFLRKTRTPSDEEEYQHYSPISFSSSEGDEEKNLRICLLDNKKLKLTEHQLCSQDFTKRPNSLDFSKKRTRGRPRRAGNQALRGQELTKLTLSDAMTLLGDGASEKSVVQRLDQSAKIVFAEMKRMNFAIRKFPMSSLDGEDNSGECDGQLKTANETAEKSSSFSAPKLATLQKSSMYKMRNERKRYTSHRRFSDSFTSQAARSKRRGGPKHERTESRHSIRDSDEKSDVPLNISLSDESVASWAISFERKDSSSSSCLPSFSPSIHQSLQVPHNLAALRNSSNNAQASVADFTAKYDGVLKTSSSSEGKPNATGQIQSPASAQRKNVREIRGSTELCENLLDSISEQAEALPNLNQSKPLETTTVQSSVGLSNSSFLTNQSSSSSSYPSPNQIHPATNFLTDQSKSDTSLSRYYHVFKKGELDELVKVHVPSVKIVDTYYDHANWCIVAQKQ